MQEYNFGSEWRRSYNYGCCKKSPFLLDSSERNCKIILWIFTLNIALTDHNESIFIKWHVSHQLVNVDAGIIWPAGCNRVAGRF